MDLSVWDKVDHQKVAAVARNIDVQVDVFWGYLIDGKAPRSVIVKMAKLFNKPFEHFVKCPCEPTKYTRNRKRWEQRGSNAE